jgi:hypothetical protein
MKRIYMIATIVMWWTGLVILATGCIAAIPTVPVLFWMIVINHPKFWMVFALGFFSLVGGILIMFAASQLQRIIKDNL